MAYLLCVPMLMIISTVFQLLLCVILILHTGFGADENNGSIGGEVTCFIFDTVFMLLWI